MARLATLAACVLVALAKFALAEASPQQLSTVGDSTNAASDPLMLPPSSRHGDQSVAPRHSTTDDARPHTRNAKAQSQPTQLARIEVRGRAPDAAIKAQRKLTPGTVSIVNGDSFYQRPTNNMADALHYVPGVFMQSSTGGDDAVLSIRGSNLNATSYDNGGVMLFEDGLPVTTADGANHNRFMNPLNARNVIVANGPNALTYGASDLGGAIDFISRTARNSDPNQIYLSGGSYGLQEGQVSTGGVSGNLDGMLTVAGRHFSGYQPHSRADRHSFTGNAGWRLSDDLRLRLFATYINDRQQLAGQLTPAEFAKSPRQADPSYLLGNHQLNVKTGRLAVKGTWTINPDSWLEFGVSYEMQSLYHPIVNTFDFSTTPPTDLFSLLISTVQRTTGGMLRYHLKAGDHQLIAGINLARTTDVGGNYDNDAGRKGSRTDDVDQRAHNVTLYLMDRWTFAPRWTFVYGTQGTVLHSNVEDISLAYRSVRDQLHTYSSINPRVGLIYAFSHDSEVFANVSRVYQPPNNFDQNNDVTQNDSVLAAMQGLSWEIGTRGTHALPSDLGRWRWSLDVYQAHIRNEILSVTDPTEPGNLLSANFPRTTHAGVEALFAASLPVAGALDRIEPLVSASYNDFHFGNDPALGNNRLPGAPQYVVHGEVMVHNAATGFYAGPTFDLVGSEYADMANTYRVGAYGLMGLRVGIQRRQWELYVAARNLTDRKYVNYVAPVVDMTTGSAVLNPGAPRSLFVGLRLHY